MSFAGSAEHPDSVVNASYSYDSDYRFRPTQLIAPAALLAVGAVGVYAFDGFRHSLQNSISSPRHTSADEYLQFLPLAAYLPAGFIPGVGHRCDFRERLLAGATSMVVVTALTEGFKLAFREPRPDDSSERNSFPSGHTARAFAGAELMRIEYGNVAGALGYAAAASVGIMRVYNNRHWYNDVLGGAALGILSARIAYWLLPFERKLFRLNRQGPRGVNNLVIVPALGSSNGFALALTF